MNDKSGYGLIGASLKHSFSPNYFNEKFKELGLNERYEAFELERIEQFPELIAAHPEFKGLNVTFPFKQSVIPYLHDLSEVAETVNAVNTIEFINGKLKGHNTDVQGFKSSLLAFIEGFDDLKAIVLGNGGASKAVQFVMQDLEIPFEVVSRFSTRGIISYDDLNDKEIAQHRLIINTTPLGNYPHINACPNIPYNAIGSDHFLFDLIYNPQQSLFLQKGMNQGAKCINGLNMLKLQAEAAWDIWNQTE